MKQIVVTGMFPFIGHTFVTREVASTHKEGDDVYVLAPAMGDAAGNEQCAKLGFPIERVIYKNFASSPIWSFDLKRFTPEVRHAAMRARYGILLGERRKSFFANLASDPRISGADLIHAHFVTWAHRVAIPLAKILGIPVSVTAHDLELPRMEPRRLQYVQEHASVITVVSADYRRCWIEKTGSDARLRIVHNGVDIQEFDGEPRSPSSGTALRLVTISRLAASKRIADGMHALRLILDRGIDAEYTIIGEGPERPALEALKAELGLGERVQLLGLVGRSGVVEELRRADVLVHPSEAESFGVAVVEGMAAGLPVVVARSGGVLDIVQHGEFGYLYDPGDIESLAGLLAELAYAGARRTKLGTKGREVAASLFSWDRHMADIRRAWADAIGSHHFVAA